MNMTRWLTMATLAMLTCTWAQADSAHFEINLAGWDPNQEFTFIGNPTLPPPSDIDPCLPAGDICGDASVRINSGGGSIPEDTTTFTFNSDDVDANGDIFFDNTSGTLLTAVEIQVTLNPDEYNDPFICDGGDIFQQCGFVLNDPPMTETLDIFFYDSYTPGGGIPSSTPEPSQWLILVLAFAAMIVVRSRKTIANAFFAQTQRLACPTRDS